MVECHSVSHCPPCGQFCMRLYGMKRINAVAYNADGKCTRRHAAAMLARSEGCARELGHDITRAPPWFYPERVRRILNSAKSGLGIACYFHANVRANILSNYRADIRKYVVSWLKHSRERNSQYPDQNFTAPLDKLPCQGSIIKKTDVRAFQKVHAMENCPSERTETTIG